MLRMQYYDFYRHYSVPAGGFKEARVKFSRALENHEEDQYYVETQTSWGTQFQQTNRPGWLVQLLRLVPWFWEEARHQIFGYPKYSR